MYLINGSNIHALPVEIILSPGTYQRGDCLSLVGSTHGLTNTTTHTVENFNAILTESMKIETEKKVLAYMCGEFSILALRVGEGVDIQEVIKKARTLQIYIK